MVTRTAATDHFDLFDSDLSQQVPGHWQESTDQTVGGIYELAGIDVQLSASLNLTDLSRLEPIALVCYGNQLHPGPREECIDSFLERFLHPECHSHDLMRQGLLMCEPADPKTATSATSAEKSTLDSSGSRRNGSTMVLDIG